MLSFSHSTTFCNGREGRHPDLLTRFCFREVTSHSGQEVGKLGREAQQEGSSEQQKGRSIPLECAGTYAHKKTKKSQPSQADDQTRFSGPGSLALQTVIAYFLIALACTSYQRLEDPRVDKPFSGEREVCGPFECPSCYPLKLGVRRPGDLTTSQLAKPYGFGVS